MDYSSSPTDVRIIVESAYDMETVSKALKNLTFEDDYNIIISSLILTRNFELIKKIVSGADVVLIATREYGNNVEFNKNYVQLLKDEVGHIERVMLSDVEEEFNSDFMSQQIENAIIRAGLSSIKILNYFKDLEKQNNLSLLKINELNKEIKDINSKNYELVEKLEEQTQINSNLQIEINSNNKHMDKLTERYNNLKTKNAYFEEKQLNEVFSIDSLWMETFNESLNDYERIIFATNQFKPKNIIIGQGLISVPNKNSAVQWLKVVKTALCFIDSKNMNHKLTKNSMIFDDAEIITEKDDNIIYDSEIPDIKEKIPKKDKEDINSRIMNLWD